MDENNSEFYIDFQNTNYFKYKGKNYPFNLNCFIAFSKYFQKNYNKFQNQKEIPLIISEKEEYINLSDDSIQSFINCCQHQKISINNQNVVHLNYLSKEYEVEQLTIRTEDYILNHPNELLLELLTINSKQRNSEWETKIAHNLPNFIHSENLCKLSIPILHNILSQNKEIDENEKIEFLFKCLDEHGKSASVLFTNTHFDNEKVKYLDRLISEYSDKIDFHFINSELIKNIYENGSELLNNYVKLNENVKKMEKIIEKQESEIIELKNLNENHNQHIQSIIVQLNEVKDQIQQLKNMTNQNNQQQNDTNSQQQNQIQAIQQQIQAANNMITNLDSIQNQHEQKIKATNEIANSMAKEIHVAYIITQNKDKKSIDLNFINDLNSKNIKIIVRTIHENELIYILNKPNPNFLMSFDVLVFGGCDGHHCFDQTKSISKFVETYNNKGGAILFLHDFNSGNPPDHFNDVYQPFSSYLGFIRNRYTENKFSKCEFVNKNSPISLHPYKINNNFDVSLTHETTIYDPKYMLIRSADGKGSHYYSENPKNKIGDCSMGHTFNILNDEKKIIYNIIYHLSQLK